MSTACVHAWVAVLTAALLVSGTLVLAHGCDFVEDPPSLACASSAWNKMFANPSLLVIAVGAFAATIAMVPFLRSIPPCLGWCIRLCAACSEALECVADSSWVAFVLSLATLVLAAWYAATVVVNLDAIVSSTFAREDACFVCPNKGSLVGTGLLWGGVACAAGGFVTSFFCALRACKTTEADRTCIERPLMVQGEL